MHPQILQTQPMNAPVLERELDAAYQVHRLHQAADPAALLEAVGPAIRAVVTTGAAGVASAILERLPALELIAIRGVGTDGVDLGYARRRGLRVTSTPGVLTEDVADLALALYLAVSRRVPAADAFVRAGRWTQGSMPLARRASGKRAGILGLGQIGRAIARRLEGFGMDVAYCGCRPQAVPYRYLPSLLELARESDVLFVAASASAENRGMVDAAVLDALGAEGLLINIARGSLVDEAALVAALGEGRLGGAGLDVFEREPQIPEALFALDNVVLQPHLGSATQECRLDMGRLVLENLANHFAGRALQDPVV